MNHRLNTVLLSSYDDLKVKSFITSNTINKIASNNNLNIHIIPEYTPISSQGAAGSCVSNACCDAMEIIKGLQNKNKVEQLSRLFIYWNARLYDKSTDKDSGTYITNAMWSLVDYGVCKESVWSYDPTKVFTQPNQLAYKQGDDNRFESFYKIRNQGQYRLNDVDAALRANHPVVFATAVSDQFQRYSGGNKVFKKPTSWIGFHAMILTGVRINSDGSRDFYVRNSWGDSWGDNGHAWISDEYVASDQTNDLYVGTTVPDLLV